MAVCGDGKEDATLSELFDADISRDDIIKQLERMRIPRYASKLMNGLIAAACDQVLADGATGVKPSISRDVFNRVSSRVEDEIRSETQDLLEVE